MQTTASNPPLARDEAAERLYSPSMPEPLAYAPTVHRRGRARFVFRWQVSAAALSLIVGLIALSALIR